MVTKESFFYHNFWGINWAFFILILHGLPGSSLPSSSWLQLINFDKLVHFSMFFILNGLLINGLRNQMNYPLIANWPIIFSSAFSIFYAIILETMQSSVFNKRSSDWNDFIADAIGALVGILLFNRIFNFIFPQR